MPAPEIEEVQHVVNVLFAVGPVIGEAWVTERDLQAWEARRDICLLPWQADLIIECSKAWLSEMHAAREADAQCPWEDGSLMWQKARNMQAEKSWDRLEEKEKRNGSRKRH